MPMRHLPPQSPFAPRPSVSPLPRAPIPFQDLPQVRQVALESPPPRCGCSVTATRRPHVIARLRRRSARFAELMLWVDLLQEMFAKLAGSQPPRRFHSCLPLQAKELAPAS